MITEVYWLDGEAYFPTTYVGSDLDYKVNFNEWLTNENDTFVSMTWNTLPAGLSSAYSNDNAGYSTIQISADSAGSYVISGIMESIESGHTQKLPVKVHLIVESLVA